MGAAFATVHRHALAINVNDRVKHEKIGRTLTIAGPLLCYRRVVSKGVNVYSVRLYKQSVIVHNVLCVCCKISWQPFKVF